MGEHCDGEFLTPACSNSAQKCFKTVIFFFRNVKEKKFGVKNVIKYKLLYHYILTFYGCTDGMLL